MRAATSGNFAAMFGEICSNNTHTFLHGNETFLFDHELECTVSKTVFVLFTFIGIAGLLGNAMVVLGEILRRRKLSISMGKGRGTRTR